jgi:single-strand DNA-binding protein
MGYQLITILGNVGKEPELRYTANGKAVCTFSVAVNERYGESESTEWFSVVAWEKLGEVVSQYVTKGKELLVSGTMRTRSWDGNDGVKHYRTELIARDVKFVGKRDAAPGGDDATPFED